MTSEIVTKVVTDALITILEASAPMLICGLVVGVIVSIFQAVTSIQEQTLAFVPKIVAIFASLLVFGTWILNILIQFTTNLFTNMGQYLG